MLTGRRQNVELKARTDDLQPMRRRAARLATDRLPGEHQVDTYFHCQQGRLKLREINATRAQLIWYRRPDQTSAKLSDYYIVEVPDPALLKAVLAGAIGIRTIVNKRREIFLYENVRIHLDDVERHGTFLELEAVLSDSETEAEGRRKLQLLARQLQVAPGDVLAKSYADLD